ncbi:MAG: hypothetical protein CVV24_07815 [Ignavibacteriae bacterium HGW-Ignavibacteriae-3]|nr:MAG: hypothetical protein CVV24_07815 [Ignavibacteriae bacterium HGW-Ignavibacteriae-3]
MRIRDILFKTKSQIKNIMERKYFFLSLAFFFLIFRLHASAQTGSPLTLSEIMFYPGETNGEFVELYNTSSTDTIDISGYKIKYYTSSPNILTSFIGGTKLSPGQFAVILQGSYDYYGGIYKTLIPANAIILKISTNNFGSSGMSNSTGRDVSLLNGADSILDTYSYTADNSAGYSDEKIILSKNNEPGNWKNSTVINGTPGFKSSVIIMPHYSRGSLVINEIMYDPGEGNSEYLEFFNASEDSIQLSGFQVNVGSASKYKMTTIFFLLPPKEYFVLSASSSIFNIYPNLTPGGMITISGTTSLSLLNEGTVIVLKDSYGTTIDSVIYTPAWHGKNVVTTKNKSLEKLNPKFDSNTLSNWNTCVSSEGGTPGRQNSIFSQNITRESTATVNPNPFSPDGDGFEDFTVINFELSAQLSQVRIKVYDSQGRLVRTLIENRLSSSNNSVVFDGMDDSAKPLRIGIYILLIETVAAGGGNVEVIKLPVVIARKL